MKSWELPSDLSPLWYSLRVSSQRCCRNDMSNTCSAPANLIWYHRSLQLYLVSSILGVIHAQQVSPSEPHISSPITIGMSLSFLFLAIT